MDQSGIIHLACNRSILETTERLESLLESAGIKIFARIDHAAEAQSGECTLAKKNAPQP